MSQTQFLLLAAMSPDWYTFFQTFEGSCYVLLLSFLNLLTSSNTFPDGAARLPLPTLIAHPQMCPLVSAHPDEAGLAGATLSFEI